MQKDDVIYRQAAINAANDWLLDCMHVKKQDRSCGLIRRLEDLPPAQPDIIRCNACKHWTQTTGDMPGFGLGDCDYLNAKFVNCNGYCYWAERREW